MKLKLIDFYELRGQLPQVINDDLSKIIESMELENISLDNWELDEIPIENFYCFYNRKKNKAFDILFEQGCIVPLYINKFHNMNAASIKEAINNYEL